MSDRINTLVCIFDPSSPRISAYNIHEWIHETLRVVEDDIKALQVDGPRRRVYIKFNNEDRMNAIFQDSKGLREYKHDNGEISQVVIEIAGLGIKKIRLAGLPPEVKEVTIKGHLAKYGEVVNIRDEIWAAAYRYKVYNGVRIAELKLKQHMPSNLTIAGIDIIVTYDGQPQTCYRCNEPGHQKIDCPRRQCLFPAPHGQRSTWAGIAQNISRVPHQNALPKQLVDETGGRPESNTSIEHKPSSSGQHRQAQGTCEQSNAIDGPEHVTTLPDPIPTPHRMDTQESTAWSDDMIEREPDCNKERNAKIYVEQEMSQVDSAVEEIPAAMHIDNDTEDEKETERLHANDNIRDEYPPIGVQLKLRPASSTSRPKKLKTDSGYSAQLTRNRSKMRTKSNADT